VAVVVAVDALVVVVTRSSKSKSSIYAHYITNLQISTPIYMQKKKPNICDMCSEQSNNTILSETKAIPFDAPFYYSY
jgi:hypothetical protein